MRVFGIICEYNPFHKGHEYQLKTVKDSGADYIICVMSGSSVQRGAPAILNKWIRAESALLSGADIVIELPHLYAVSSAEMFAYGAVSLLEKLHVCTDLNFGASANIADIQKTAQILNEQPEGLKELITAELDKGLGYPHALSNALYAFTKNDSIKNVLSDPNSVLAIEYVKALMKLSSKIVPSTVTRIGASHNDLALGEFSSATAIRNAFYNNELEKALPSLPDFSQNALKKADEIGNYPDMKRYELLCMEKLRLLSLDELRKIPDMTEGLENKFYKHRNLPILEAVIQAVKSRRFTRARIDRILSYCILGITYEYRDICNYLSGSSYARILGMKRTAAPLIKLIKERSSLPIITSVADSLPLLNGAGKNMLAADIRSTDIHSLLMAGEACRAGGLDYTHPMVIL